MSVRKISKTAFENLVETLLKTERIEAVQAKGDKFDFARLEAAEDLRLDYDIAMQPLRKYFLPPVETLMTYDITENYKSKLDCEKFILLGVHPYDMVAINQMDKIFGQDNKDIHYFARRNNATIIACDVVTPSKNVFASSMGTATVDSGYDVILTDIGDSYIAEAATDKGEAILAKADAKDAEQADLEKREQIRGDNKKNLNKHELKCRPEQLPELLEKAYDNPVWEEKAKTCFSCGSCNQVCPTCYCFDVKDDVNWDLKTGKRERSWDGCLLDGFTKVAGEHEFRKNRADRFRHRLYRKGKYVPAKIDGEIACVGCGRCISACLPDIANPVSIYNKLIDDIGV